MGWKGTVRTLGAMHKASVRESERIQKENLKRSKALEKLEVLEQAKYEVEEYTDYIQKILSVHKKDTDLLEWDTIIESNKPTYPIKKNNAENLHIGFFKKIFGREESIREKAKTKDEQLYQQNIIKWKKQCLEW